MNVSEALKTGLECDDIRLRERSQNEILESLIRDEDLWTLPTAYARRAANVMQELRAASSRHLTALTQLSHHTRDKTSLALAQEGYCIQKSIIPAPIIKQIRMISRSSYLWTLMTHKHISSTDNLQSGHGTYWPVSPDCLEKIFELLGNTLVNHHLESLVNLGFRLDNIHFSLTRNYNSLKSTQWHRDSVGNRIKIFICLGSCGITPGTSFIPTSHLSDPQSNNIDIIRTFKMFKGDWSLQAEIVRILQTKFGAEPITFFQSAGDALYIDTNGYHKSFMPWNEDHSRREEGQRLLLQLEYMQGVASDYAHLNRIGPCAPGQVPVFVDKSSLSRLISSGVDIKCIHDLGTISESMKAYLYSKHDRLNTLVSSYLHEA